MYEQLRLAAGSIPPEWGQQGSLQKLIALDISKGSLTGTLPASWATQMPGLGAGLGNGVWFEDNLLTGEGRSLAHSAWRLDRRKPMSDRPTS